MVAKPVDGSYQPDKRVMLKIKHERDCDCVVAGFRWYKEAAGKEIGSLLLGLYNDEARCSTLASAPASPKDKRRELLDFLAPYRENALAGHPWKDWAEARTNPTPPQRMPGAQSRWSHGKDLSWEPLRPELVVEVAYEHMQAGRFRHMAQFRRWRTDKTPSQCTYAQLEVVPPEELKSIFSLGR